MDGAFSELGVGKALRKKSTTSKSFKQFLGHHTMYRRSNTFAALFENAKMGPGNQVPILDHYIYTKMCFYLFLQKLKYYINWYIILIKEYVANRVNITGGIWRRTLIRISFLLGVLLHSPFFWLDPLWGPKRRKTMKYGVASNKASIEAMASTTAV